MTYNNFLYLNRGGSAPYNTQISFIKTLDYY